MGDKLDSSYQVRLTDTTDTIDTGIPGGPGATLEYSSSPHPAEPPLLAGSEPPERLSDARDSLNTLVNQRHEVSLPNVVRMVIQFTQNIKRRLGGSAKPKLLALLMLGLSPGCGVLRVQPMANPPSPMVSDPELASCDRLDESNAAIACEKASSASFPAFGRERLAMWSAGWEERWHQSPLAIWAARQREKKTAPPFPRFHPLPTHAVFYPE
jgi:hypothetical protein